MNIHWKDWCWSSNTLATWCEELTHQQKPWCWERLKTGGKGNNRGWDGWIASPSQRMWVWANFRNWWWTGKAGVLESIGPQRVGHDWATELNWSLDQRAHCNNLFLLNNICIDIFHRNEIYREELYGASY